MADIDEGETLWIYPDQWIRSGDPDGFPMRVVELIGRDGLDSKTLWVRGVALDRVTGLPVQEIVIQIPHDQPRAEQGRLQSPASARPVERAEFPEPSGSVEPPEPVDLPEPVEPPEHLQVGKRRYRRVY